MKKKVIFTLLMLFGLVGTAYAQSSVAYPVYQTAMERGNVCQDVVVERGPNVAGTVIGAVVGYAIGRELDRGTGGYSYYGHNRGRYYRDPYYGGYYRDNYRHGHYRHSDSRVGRVGGTVVGGVIGSQVGRGGRSVQRVCEPTNDYHQVLIGHTVVTTMPNGTTREQFIPIR